MLEAKTGDFKAVLNHIPPTKASSTPSKILTDSSPPTYLLNTF